MKKYILILVLFLVYLNTNNVFSLDIKNYTIDNDISESYEQISGQLKKYWDISLSEISHVIKISQTDDLVLENIPAYTDLEKLFIQKIWLEKFWKLVKNHTLYNVGWYHREDIRNNNYDYTKKKILSTQIHNRRYFDIFSEKKQKIKLELYPVPTEKFSWLDQFLMKQGNISDQNLLAYYDSTVEYYDISTELTMRKISSTQWKIEKKYKFIEYNIESKIHDAHRPIYKYLVYTPYYEITANVEKWNTLLKLEYSTYWNVSNNYWSIFIK